jgi:hypothetical protein
MDKEQTEKKENLVKNFDENKFSFSPKLIGVLLVLVILGVLGGYFLSRKTSVRISGTPNNQVSNPSQVTTGSILGTNDTSTFKDTAEGTVTAGGIEGEGQFHLVRPGGDSQSVYLTSSTVDLSLVLGKKVKVWGQTQTAQHAGWLMDVGRVQVE